MKMKKREGDGEETNSKKPTGRYYNWLPELPERAGLLNPSRFEISHVPNSVPFSLFFFSGAYYLDF